MCNATADLLSEVLLRKSPGPIASGSLMLRKAPPIIFIGTGWCHAGHRENLTGSDWPRVFHMLKSLKD